jgi:hypothetical protein
MTNYADDFELSPLVVQQTEIYYDVRIDTGAITLAMTSTLISDLWLKI